ncbi:FAD/NAD(P)-binding domain-containing protein [Thozetella sp. PMI_491]|nr:FAD/NAD(P)-binding domain-containing protein [Thozetella sp. PMI_491]
MAQLNGHEFSAAAIAEIEAKYAAERDKRLNERPQGEAQFVDLTLSEKFRHLQDDPWPIKYLVIGTGFSGLLFAVRLLEAGASLDELLLIDSSGGYGGVWYWNRFPGVMCDVESYIYMPLLEETGYMPKHKYSYGPELRAHAERIADHWNLRGRTLFRQHAKQITWDDSQKEWKIQTQFVGNKRDLDLKLDVKYVLLAGGQLTHAKIPIVEGLDTFKGHIFHTSRWDYNYTGGSSQDGKPEMTKLKDKVVAIIGTGATAVQAVPELAKYAKKLFVVQRTPSSIDVRNQRETDPEEWKKMTSEKGWWWDRNVNFAQFLHQKQPPPAVNLVSDGWIVDNPSYCTAWGYDGGITEDQIPKYVEKMHVEDIPRAERIRHRVEEIIMDKETADHLKHWYPSWCKRPCFHDDYLPAFNQPNVTLIDTSGHGVDRFTEKGVVVNGKEYEIDLLVLSTGYKVLGGSTNISPAARFGITITGKDGLDMDTAFQELSTLHGLCRAGFPNMFFAGSSQASLTANQIMSMDIFAQHSAYILTEGQRMAGTPNAVIESTQAAEDDWGNQVAAASGGMSAMVGCTPNYFNLEGELDKLHSMGPEVQAKMKKGGLWGRGINHYAGVLGKWRSNGGLKGFDVQAAGC